MPVVRLTLHPLDELFNCAEDSVREKQFYVIFYDWPRWARGDGRGEEDRFSLFINI